MKGDVMSTKNQIFRLLMEHRGESVSGQTIGSTLGISRAAVWKGITALRKDGYPIEAITNKGYCLSGTEDYLSAEEIKARLRPEIPPMEIRVFDTVESTNKTAKEAALSEPDHTIIFLANQQTAGRGRLGRSFYSPENTGLYMSILFRPTFDLHHSILITTAAAVAVVRGIEALSPIKLDIKWVNDIYYNDKKICGILTEAISDFETGRIGYVVLGIGINCFDAAYPEALNGIAGNLGGGFTRNQLAAEIIKQWNLLLPTIENREFLEEYRSRSIVLGKEILVYPAGDKEGEGVLAQVLSIDDDGGLLVRYLAGPDKGQAKTLSGGEVSIRKA
jgi:BirA family transcriptional regulator, biotin operon repressor / biotin---[acetyl-CoA-carboxylase] ligase